MKSKWLLRRINTAVLGLGCVLAAIILASTFVDASRKGEAPAEPVEAANHVHEEGPQAAAANADESAGAEEHVVAKGQQGHELPDPPKSLTPADTCCPAPGAAPGLAKTATGAEGAPEVEGHEGVEMHERAEEHEAAEEHEVELCGEHNVAEAECGICNPAATAALRPGEGLKIRLAAEHAAERAGVEVGPPSAGAAAEGAEFLARVTYNQNRVAHVTPRVSGVVDEVLADLGAEVGAGTPLARVSAPEAAQAWGELQSAEAEEALAREIHAREKMLWEKEVSSTQEYRTAEAALRQARIRTQLAGEQLNNLGVQAEGGARGGSSITVTTPLAGTIVDRHAVVGETVERGDALFTVADLSGMWLELTVPVAAVAAVHTGDAVEARFQGLEGMVLEGTVEWIDAKVDPDSRTVRARASVANPAAVLKDGMVGKVRVQHGAALSALHVPAESIQEFDGKPYVFVKLAADLYEVRQVALGQAREGRVAVVEGLAPEEDIVLARSFTVKSEFLKSRLGAGCTDE
ncbi:MAG: efflux RND transporter periplasmic adaptor subunit [Candidatus Hydrogenedentes bacterium]|nr:efflux RND transporter periplasmic adaptor subunit [Candidatus Hydrogenedentota bacterium]